VLGLVSRTRCGAQRCSAEPGPTGGPSCRWTPDQQRTTSCCAASGERTYQHPGHSMATRLRLLAARCARALPEISVPSQIRGRRECRVRAAPAVSCAMCTKSAHTSIQGSGEHPTFPAQGKINSPVKFCGALWTPQAIDHPRNIPITSHIASLDLPHTFGTLRGDKTWHASNATAVWKAEPRA
jgi:hypothetical protein